MGVLRLQMHATAPDPAEQTLGTPQSEGCVRIPALLNEFVDRHGCRAKTVNDRGGRSNRLEGPVWAVRPVQQ